MNQPEQQSTTSTEEQITYAYQALYGTIPAFIISRIDIAKRTDRLGTLETVEQLRHKVIMQNSLGLKIQQLVQFGQLLALGHHEQASRHAGSARQAGATLQELIGVVETALLTAGMPAYHLGLSILAQHVELEPEEESPDTPLDTLRAFE